MAIYNPFKMVMLHSYVSLPEGICVCGINDWNKTIGIRLGRIIGIITRGNDSDNNWKQNVWISAFFSLQETLRNGKSHMEHLGI